jgi:arogenate dehydrogenase (NADP+)
MEAPMTPVWQSRPVGLVGLGLIGGSLGLDLRRKGAVVHALVHRSETAERARQRGLADRVATDPALLADCGLVILCLPLDRLVEPDPALLAALPPEACVTDVGSVKGPVLAAWEPLLGGRFVASHPMAGTARSGVEAGEEGLFRGRPWVLTPTPRTDPEALWVVEVLAEALGAIPIRCGAAEHDRAVALISHLPVLVSAALLQAADQGAGVELGPLVRALASTGFADTTRVGGGNPDLGVLMARHNRPALQAALAAYRSALGELEQRLGSGDWEGLRCRLQDARNLRPPFLKE